MKPRRSYLALPWLLALTGATPAAVLLDDPLTFPDTPPASPARNFARPSATFRAADAAPGLSVDTRQREAVRNFYNALFYASENIPMNWTGNIAGCAAGDINPAYREAGLLRINMLRALAGVPAAVTLDDSLNAKAQQAALMMSAQNALSHFPDTNWACRTADGAEAAGRSNLSLGYAGAEAIAFGQMEDEGDNNTAAGHRRWLLYPQTQEMGLGDVAGDGTQDHLPANAVWVQDSHIHDPRPAPRDDFVAWPPPGYLPYTLAFPRWSLSYPGADFSQASVSVRRNGADVAVTPEPLAFNIGENTLVWRTPIAAPPVDGPQPDAAFSVSVRNVRVNGQARDFAYDVTLFDPDRYDTDTVLPQVVGPAQPAAGRSNAYATQGVVPAADGYDWLHAGASAFTAAQGAENGLGDLTPDTTPGYSVDTDEFAAAGKRSYHLMDARAKRQSLALDRWLVPGLKAKLKFQSRLALATPSESAAVQVSLDGGNVWRDVYTQFGNDSGFPVENAFAARAIALDEFAGRLVRVRFVFDIPDRRSFSFFSPGANRGWYLDDIAFEDATALDAPAVAAADADGHFAFTPAATGDHLLAVRGTLRGHPLEWGPARSVRAVAAGPNQAPVANAGPDQAAAVGTVVNLNGGGSADPDNGPGPLSFVWSQISGPAAVTLANVAQPSFTPTVPGSYVFGLTVNDTDLSGPADTVAVLVSAAPVPVNQAPTADAGPDQTAPVGAEITLDGTASRDPDNAPNPLSFAWTQLSGPAAVTLANASRPSFTPQAAGSYVFSLTVGDGELASAPDTVVITATAPVPPAPLTLLSPNGGEDFKAGQSVPVRWQSSGVAAKASLQLQFSKNGVKWTLLKTVKNSGRTTWKPTKAQAGEAVRLRLCGPTGLPKASRCDETDGTFRVRR
jgi:hypothetical protein